MGHEAAARRPWPVAARIRYQAIVVEVVGVLAATLLLALYLVWPLPYHLDEWIFGYPGDSTGLIAYLWLLAHDLGFDVTGTTHVDAWGAPYGFDQPSSVNLTLAVTLFPGYVLAEIGHEVAAYNLTVISGLALSGAAMYWLVRALGLGRLVAGWAAVVYMVFPWHLEKAQGHAAYVHLEGFPLLLLALFAWRRRPDRWRVFYVLGAYGVIWMTAGYFGLVATVALATLAPLIAVGHARRFGAARAARKAAALAGTLLLVPGALYVAASVGARGTDVLQPRLLQELSTYGARPWEYVLPSYRHPYFGGEVGPWLLARLHGSNFSETSLYVGWVTIALAAGWLVWALLRRASLTEEHRFLAVALPTLAAVAVAFSLPSPLWEGGPPGPSRALWALTPYFRVPTRFIALVMTALVPLGALGLARLLPRFGRPVHRVTFVALVTMLSFWELSFIPPRLLTDVSTRPPEYGSVARVPVGALAEYPLVAAEQALNSEYLFRQRVHGRPLVNGAPDGTRSDAVRETLVNPGDRSTAPTLATLGVTAIVVHGAFYPGTGLPPPPENLGPGYREVAKYPDGSRVLRVIARPAPAIVLYTAGFGASEVAAPHTTSRWLGAPRGRIEFMTNRPGRYTARFRVAAYERPQRLTIIGASGRTVVPVPAVGGSAAVTVSLPRGRSWLEVTASPGLRTIPDGRRVSVYVGNWSFAPSPTSRTGRAIAPFRVP